jgi:hypothetical protein
MTEMILRPRTLTSAYGSRFRPDKELGHNTRDRDGGSSTFAVEGSHVTSVAYVKDPVVLLLRSGCEDDGFCADQGDGDCATSTGVNPIGDEVRLSLTSSSFEIDEAPATSIKGMADEYEALCRNAADDDNAEDGSPMISALVSALSFGRRS